MALATLAGVLALVWLSGDPGTDPSPPARLGTAEPGGESAGELPAGPAGLAPAEPAEREALGAPPPDARWVAPDRVDQSPRPPRPGSEKALHAAYLEQARNDPEAFRERCAELLDGGTLAEKAAAMRAWYDAKLEPRYEAFAQALGSAESETELREFALRFLGDKAPSDGAAREVLAKYLTGGAADVRGRYLAVYPVLRWGDDREVGACVTALFAEREPTVVQRAAEALQLSNARNAPLVLRDLRQGHPRAEVRAALKD